MSKFKSENLNYTRSSNHYNNNNYENDDLISFKHETKTINITYSQLVKYSKHARDEYIFSAVANELPQEINKLQEELHVSSDNIFFFFQLLNQSYDVEEETNFTYIECIDLIKISKYFQVRKLSDFIDKFINDHNSDVDFIIQMIQFEISLQNDNKNSNYDFDISNEIEYLLPNRVNECLSNDKFSQLPISIIYRVLRKSSIESNSIDQLYDLIKKSISKFSVLFEFIDLERLSTYRLDELCETYANSDKASQKYFNYLKCNLKIISEMNKNKKSLENKLKSTDETNNKQKNQLCEYKAKIDQLQKQLNESINEKNKSEELNRKLQDQLKVTEEAKNEIQKEKDKVQRQLDEYLLQKQLEEKCCLIQGKIIANVKKGLIIYAQIKFELNGSSIDPNRSRYIISTSDMKTLGVQAYEEGEPITSPQMNTKEFICKSGTYYVRCIVFDMKGNSNEFLSNPVTTSGTSVSFLYEGKPSEISLMKGEYKLEVWGAKGGDSTGTRDSQPGKGGLGGYSCGVLTLNEAETAYIYVGGEGKPSKLEEGATNKGGFPDGGNTKTGFFNSEYTASPGTGGGSTSIRLKSDSDYSRVIVAGGGGGASGCYRCTDRGGFGGGLEGGNYSYDGSLTNQGSGTQTGSSCGLGYSSKGDQGTFGFGAAGKYKYEGDSGGGGGGGWYGGGGGGNGTQGSSGSSSGGGGSGWTFTESSFNFWRSNDSTNASKFILNKLYHLSDTMCVGGDKEFPTPDGNGTECGHSGNGYVKITPK